MLHEQQMPRCDTYVFSVWLPLKGSFILDCFDRKCHMRYNRKDKQIIQHFNLARLRWLGGLSHIRTVMFCLYRYPHDIMQEILTKEDNVVTLSVIIITIVYGTVSSVLATYIVRFIDKKAQK